MPDVQGGKITVIDNGMIARAVGRARTFIDGVTQAWFGPGQPQQPMAPAGTQARQMDYGYGVNLQYIPRSDAEVSFDQLRSLADALPLLRVAIETRKDQVQNVDWTVRIKNKRRGEKAQEDKDIEQIISFLQYPDGEHDFRTWTRMLMEEMLVIDAACLEPQMTRGGEPYAFLPVDGATIKRLIDENGRTPIPPDPAYQQVLHGVPAIDFTRDQLLYLARNVRVNRFYGFSAVEQIILTINIALRRELYTLNYYTAGSVPDAIAALPKEWTIDQVKAFQEYWDYLLSGNLAQRRKMKFVPGGGDFKLNETKQPPLKDQYDEWIARVICWALSVSVTPLVQQTNRATAETQRVTAAEEGLQPTLAWITSFMNLILWKYFRRTDIEFAFETKKNEDVYKAAQAADLDLRNGSRTLDEIREGRGDEPLGINEPMIYLSTGPIPLKEALDQAKEDILNPPEPPPQLMGAPNALGNNLVPGSTDDNPAPADKGDGEVGEVVKATFRKGTTHERIALRKAGAAQSAQRTQENPRRWTA